ncbi:MAG: four helix bundle protein [Deltaproteobacteria bacterium]|nr:four helix bundle protein [Deltaproteobacteria bacterium]
MISEGSRVQGFKGSSVNALKTTEGSKGSRVQRFKRKARKYLKKGTQILLAGDLGFIEKSELDTLKKDIAEIERMLTALIKSLENKPLNPWTLFSN